MYDGCVRDWQVNGLRISPKQQAAEQQRALTSAEIILHAENHDLLHDLWCGYTLGKG